MSHITIPGTSVSDRLVAARDNFMWGVTKIVLIGGILVSVPGVVTGVIVPGEGMDRTDTVIQNVVHDHSVVWGWVGNGINSVVSFMEEESQS